MKDERNDQDIATWRRLEAKLGYDVDSAADHLIETLLKYVKTYGHSGVEEAIVAIQGEATADTLGEEIDVAKRSRVVCDLHEAVATAGNIRKGSSKPTWETAEEAAMAVRHGMGVQGRPLANPRLADLLNISKDDFRGGESEGTKLHYGLRLRRGDGGKNVVALCARWSQARRFELCRTLGDAISQVAMPLGP